jgi:hypothetical protein
MQVALSMQCGRRGQHARGGALSMQCGRRGEAGEAHHRGRQVQTVQEGVKRVDPHREYRRQGRPDQTSAEDSGGRERGLKVRP